MKIDGKTIWITGASSGIGEALTYLLDKRNCKIILSSRNEEELQRVKTNCVNKSQVKILAIDLAEFNSMPTLVEKAINVFGTIDILINNAGLSQRSLIAETKFEVYKKLMDINYLGTVSLTKALLPYFIENQKGHFALSSVSSGRPIPLSVYSKKPS